MNKVTKIMIFSFISALFLVGVFLIFDLYQKNDSLQQEVNRVEKNINKKIDFTKIFPSIVKIHCLYEGEELSLFGDGNSGSGIIFSPAGYVLTAKHIPQSDPINNPEKLLKDCLVIPSTANGELEIEQYVAEVYEVSTQKSNYDLAILKINGEIIDGNIVEIDNKQNQFTGFDNLFYCGLGNYNINIGDKNYVLGYPAISDSNLMISDGVIASHFNDVYYLTTAKVDSGNSGGIVINENGCGLGMILRVNDGDFENYGVILPINIIEQFFTNLNIL